VSLSGVELDGGCCWGGLWCFESTVSSLCGFADTGSPLLLLPDMLLLSLACGCSLLVRSCMKLCAAAPVPVPVDFFGMVFLA